MPKPTNKRRAQKLTTMVGALLISGRLTSDPTVVVAVTAIAAAAFALTVYVIHSGARTRRVARLLKIALRRR